MVSPPTTTEKTGLPTITSAICLVPKANSKTSRLDLFNYLKDIEKLLFTDKEKLKEILRLITKQ